MSVSATVPASTFARRFAHYQNEALREKVIVVTSHHRVVGAYLSAEEFARYERLKARKRQVYRTEELPVHLVAALEVAEYGGAPE